MIKPGKTVIIGAGHVGSAVLNSLLTRAGREDIATLTTIAGLIIVLLMVVDLVSGLFTTVKTVFSLY